MGKPSKNQRVAGERTVEKVLLGKPIMYMGLGDRTFTCPTCGRTYNKGMMYEHLDKSYCSRRCITI